MGVLESSVWIDAAPQQVWRTYVDPGRIPEWQTGKPVIEDVRGAPGEPDSSYASRRGPLVGRTTVVTADVPSELVTWTKVNLGLKFEVTSRLSERSGGTDLQQRTVTHWRRGFGAVGRIVELAIFNPREVRKELALLKSLVEGEAPA